MTGYLLAGWNTARVPMGFADLDNGAAGSSAPTGAFALASAKYAHADLSPVMGAGLYDDFATALGAAMGAAHAGGDAFTVAWSSSTLRYTITCDSNEVYMDFRSVPGRQLAAALGINYLNVSAVGGSAGDPYNVLIPGAAGDGTGPIAGNVVPYYALQLAYDGISGYRRPYEVDGQTQRQVSVNGSAYSVGPTVREERTECTFRFMSLASVWTTDADDSVAPWTYEDLVKHVRCVEPILVHTASSDIVCKRVSGEWSKSEHAPEFGDYHGLWRLDVELQHLGPL